MHRTDFTTNGISPNEWEEKDYNLLEFTHKFPLPQVVRFTKAQCISENASNLSSKYLSQMALITHVVKRHNVAAQCVKFKDKKRATKIGNKLSIPETYEGWFEILSENGRAIKCIEIAGDLLRTPCSMFLVRENVKVYLAEKENQTLISDKTKIVREGETLVIAGELIVAPDKSKYGGHYLRCFTTKGEPLFLNVYQRGKFSVIGGEDGISGVHTIKQIISSKRFPLMVRLVYGKSLNSHKIGSEFSTEMRLFCVYKEESIMVLPLLKVSDLIAFPLSEQIRVQVPSNPERLTRNPIFRILAEKSNNLYQEACDKIKLFDLSSCKQLCKPSIPYPKSEYGSHIADTGKQVTVNISEYIVNEWDYDYDEIEEIYSFVRGRGNSSQNEIKHSSTASSSPLYTDASLIPCCSDKPEPPPIETIPVGCFVKADNPILPPEQELSIIYGDFELIKGHIYQRVQPKRDYSKNNSEKSITNHGKRYIPKYGNHGINKFSISSPAESRIHLKSNNLNHSHISQYEAEKYRKSTTSAPIFNMRYKSLQNLSSIDADSYENRNVRYIGDNWKLMRRHPSATSILGFGRSREASPDKPRESESRCRPFFGIGKLFKRHFSKSDNPLVL